MKKSENSESEEEIQSVDEVVEQFQSLERIVSPENEPSKVELEELELEKMRVDEKIDEKIDEIDHRVEENLEQKGEENVDDKVDETVGEKVDEKCYEEEIQSNDEINPKTDNKAKNSIYGDIENVDKNDDFDDAFVSTGEGAVLEDDFGGFGEANPDGVFDASFGEFKENGDQMDHDDFGAFGETVEPQDEDDDFGDFGENDNDFGDFTESEKAAPVQEIQSDLEPVSLAPVWEELKDATFYEYEEPEKIEFAWERSRESIDKLNDFLNASALELTWNASASKKMLDYVMPKFLQLTRDVEIEREAELEKIRKEKDEQSALKNKMSTEAKNLLAQLPDLSYLNP